MLVKLAAALLVLSVLEQVVGLDNTDIHDSLPEKPVSQKGRLSLQNTGKKLSFPFAESGVLLGWCKRSRIASTWGLSVHVFQWLRMKPR